MPLQHVHVTRGADLQVSGAQSEGMIRQNAIAGLADNICASVMIAKPQTASAVHHHGEQDTVVYAAKGHGTVFSKGGEERQNLAPGDFALIPAFAEHQEVNDSEEDVVWIITRTGREPFVRNLEGWNTSKRDRQANSPIEKNK